MSVRLTGFAAGYGFRFDPFQLEACADIDAGHGVLVAAPTGSGKTVVGEYACYCALSEGRRCFYTTPIKALSNQKYHDLVERHGSGNVGLLTGDMAINGDAPVVVMTTEVLRNMIYAGSRGLGTLGYVVLDEVHYLSDRFRGAVWEEVILGLADSVQIVALSATVSNAEEFGDWLDTVRGNVDVIVWENRPVPLYQHVMAGHELLDLFGDDRARVNPALMQLAKQEARAQRDDSRRPRGRNGRGRRTVTFGSGQFGGAASGHFTQRHAEGPRLTPTRAGTVHALSRAGLLPAIFFIFSRKGCDGAVRQLLNSDVRLTSRPQAAQLREIAERHAAALSAEERRILGWHSFVEALTRGVAAHHAGLLPTFKAIVEEGFTAGLIKVVFATETLALGINMPARTVVIERLVKYNGESNADITPGEFTQLTGRAGRRGIDSEGHAVVLWQPGMDPRAVAGLASRRTYPLRSSFSTNYNMAVNLVHTVGRSKARGLLEQSFAQFQADRQVVALARQGSAVQARADQLWEQARCDRGDFAEYARLREQIGELEDERARLRRQDRRAGVLDALERLEPGDLCRVGGGRHRGWMVVVQAGVPGAREVHPLVMDEKHQLVRIVPAELTGPPQVVSRVRIPKRFTVHSATDRRTLARAFDARVASLDESVGPAPSVPLDEQISAQLDALRAALLVHPCHSCPERESHARLAEQALRLEREQQHSRARGAARANSVAARFDRTCAVLDALGYLDPRGGRELPVPGLVLTRIYTELDLVTVEAIRRGVFGELTGPALGAVLASLLYESRATGPGPAQMPDEASERAYQALRGVWRDVGMVERDHRVERGRDLDTGFSQAVWLWAHGADLATVLSQTGFLAGDFVRWIRQVIDLAGQIGAAPGLDGIGAAKLGPAARSLVTMIRRGIVDVSLGPDD
ncbi:ATP-dependent RNA helicase HelY [Propionibacterium cyclohexanicum]|uniref:ATP-dependent RNA helicase HelY n=1 Tax=Propionibacterium cyclohexanicum TaxID=64702 RepID=A0A1H9QT60_9ACTN|nr:DEAD/DEAH box helicase [Propionibacterium cyclohexanicum]SER63652.1 ATP-dependent RNA helicase HelY [Propionibacterium cyclohexanicum]